MPFSTWSTTAADNTSVGGVNINEGCDPGNVNNGMRAIMAEAKAGVPALVASTTDNAIARFDGTSGQMQNSLVTISDTGVILSPEDISSTDGTDAAKLSGGNSAKARLVLGSEGASVYTAEYDRSSGSLLFKQGATEDGATTKLTVTASGGVTTAGNLTSTGTLTAGGAASLNAGAAVTGTLSASGLTTLSAGANVTGTLAVTGAVSANGRVTGGASSTDTVSLGYLSGTISIATWGLEGTSVWSAYYNRSAGAYIIGLGATEGGITSRLVMLDGGNNGIGYGTPISAFSVNGGMTIGQNTTLSPGLANTTTGVGIDGASGSIFASRNDGNSAIFSNTNTDGGAVFSGQQAGTARGSITASTTALSFNTTSDYRLEWKVGAVPLTDSGSFIDKLKPYWFPLANHGGFIAHEFQAVSPSSVSGAKDAVNEDGAPVYQSMQASSSDVMANLIAEIQSLRGRVADLEKHN